MFEKLRRLSKGKKGFTLIELIIVIAILAVLAAIIVPRFTNFTTSAKINKLASDCKTINKAIITYYTENDAYPTLYQLESMVPAITGSETSAAYSGGTLVISSTDGSFTLSEPATPKYYAYCDISGRIMIADCPLTAATAVFTLAENATVSTGKVLYNSTLH